MQINDPLRVSVDVQEVSVQGGVLQIPGEILTAEGQISKSFPAAGREEVREKAAGVITIYNVFSSAPQTLVVGLSMLHLRPRQKLILCECAEG